MTAALDSEENIASEQVLQISSAAPVTSAAWEPVLPAETKILGSESQHSQPGNDGSHDQQQEQHDQQQEQQHQKHDQDHQKHALEQEQDQEDVTLIVCYPEKNWRVLLGSFFGIASSWGLFFICGTFQDYYSKHQLKQYTSFQISWIFSLYYFLIVSGNLLTGLYFDFFGFRKFLALLLIPGYVLLPFVESFWEILCVFVCIGLGGGIIIPPILGCISDYFYEKRNFANSVAITGGNIVGIIYPIILEKGFSSIGYRNTSFIVSGTFLVQLVLCLILCRDRRELRRKLKPQESFFSLYFTESLDYRSLFTDVKFALVAVGIAAAELSTATLLVYITSYCSDILRFRDAQSFNIVTVLNVGALCGGCGVGIFIADRIGKINSMIAVCFNMLALNLVVWLWLSPRVPDLMYLFSILWGFNYGGMMSLCPSVCGIVSNYYDFGKKYSTVYFVVGLGFFAGIPISGVIIGPSRKGNYDRFNLYCSVFMLLAVLCFIGLKLLYLQRSVMCKNSERRGDVDEEVVEEVQSGDGYARDEVKLTLRMAFWSRY